MSRKLIRPNNPELRASYMSTSRLREKKQFTQDVTEFYIPGLDVRVHYVSKTENEDTLFFDPSASFSKDSTWMTSGRNQKKKATLSGNYNKKKKYIFCLYYDALHYKTLFRNKRFALNLMP